MYNYRKIKIQGLANVVLQLFTWKIILQLINDNIKINCVPHAENYKSVNLHFSTPNTEICEVWL